MLSASELSDRLARDAEAVCRYYLSAGHGAGNYWIVGDVANSKGRSLYVHQAGPRKGRCPSASSPSRAPASPAIPPTRPGASLSRSGGSQETARDRRFPADVVSFRMSIAARMRRKPRPESPSGTPLQRFGRGCPTRATYSLSLNRSIARSCAGMSIRSCNTAAMTKVASSTTI